MSPASEINLKECKREILIPMIRSDLGVEPRPVPLTIQSESGLYLSQFLILVVYSKFRTISSCHCLIITIQGCSGAGTRQIFSSRNVALVNIVYQISSYYKKSFYTRNLANWF